MLSLVERTTYYTEKSKKKICRQHYVFLFYWFALSCQSEKYWRSIISFISFNRRIFLPLRLSFQTVACLASAFQNDGGEDITGGFFRQIFEL